LSDYFRSVGWLFAPNDDDSAVREAGKLACNLELEHLTTESVGEGL